VGLAALISRVGLGPSLLSHNVVIASQGKTGRCIAKRRDLAGPQQNGG
jgi:hypothetical protein